MVSEVGRQILPKTVQRKLHRSMQHLFLSLPYSQKWKEI